MPACFLLISEITRLLYVISKIKQPNENCYIHGSI